MERYSASGAYYIVNDAKAKTALLFLHGAGSNHTTWKPFIDAFASYRCIAMDLRGHGRSKPGSYFSFEDSVDDIYEIIRKEKADDLIIIGHCLGANIAVEFYRKHPSLVQKMILVNPFGYNIVNCSFFLSKLSKLGYYLAKVLNLLGLKRKNYKYPDYSRFKTEPSLLFPLLDLAGTSKVVYFDSIIKLFRYKMDFGQILSPFIVVLGSKDMLISAAKIKALTGNVHILKGIDHLIVTRKPKEFFDLIGEFIENN